MESVIAKVLENLGVPSVILLFFILFVRGTFVLRKHYDQAIADRDFWRSIALQNGNIADKVLDHKDAGVYALETIKKEALEGKS